MQNVVTVAENQVREAVLRAAGQAVAAGDLPAEPMPAFTPWHKLLTLTLPENGTSTACAKPSTPIYAMPKHRLSFCGSNRPPMIFMPGFRQSVAVMFIGFSTARLLRLLSGTGFGGFRIR